MGYDRKYLVWALAYAAIGMLLGIVMAASGNHMEKVTHAHILLVGFVVSFIYAVIHKLWLPGLKSRIATVQFALHQGAAVVMFVGLFLLYGNYMAADKLEPILAPASIVVLVAALLMIYMVVKAKPAQP